MLGVRLDLGFTLSEEKSLLELIQKALNSAMSCLSAVESVFADVEPLVRALQLLCSCDKLFHIYTVADSHSMVPSCPVGTVSNYVDCTDKEG